MPSEKELQARFHKLRDRNCFRVYRKESSDVFMQRYVNFRKDKFESAIVPDFKSPLLEYLDEVYPDPPLMPQNAMARARVRALCMMAVADIHPLVVPRVRKYMTDKVGLDEAALNQWIENWTNLGLAAMEAHIEQNNPDGIYCEGDSVSLADLCLIPQVGAAKMFGFDVSPYPHLSRIFETCMSQPEFFDSRPQVQPDYPKE